MAVVLLSSSLFTPLPYSINLQIPGKSTPHHTQPPLKPSPNASTENTVQPMESVSTPALFPPAMSGDAAPSPACCPEPPCSTALGYKPAAALQTENENVSGGS